MKKEFFDKVERDFKKIRNNFVKENHRTPTNEEIERLENKYCLDHFPEFINTLTTQEMRDVCNQMIEKIQTI